MNYLRSLSSAILRGGGFLATYYKDVATNAAIFLGSVGGLWFCGDKRFLSDVYCGPTVVMVSMLLLFLMILNIVIIVVGYTRDQIWEIKDLKKRTIAFRERIRNGT